MANTQEFAAFVFLVQLRKRTCGRGDRAVAAWRLAWRSTRGRLLAFVRQAQHLSARGKRKHGRKHCARRFCIDKPICILIKNNVKNSLQKSFFLDISTSPSMSCKVASDTHGVSD